MRRLLYRVIDTFSFGLLLVLALFGMIGWQAWAAGAPFAAFLMWGIAAAVLGYAWRNPW